MRTDYDRLIEEYMAGTMSPAALRAFDQQLASDPALRRLLDAELEITRTVRRDTAAVPTVKPVMSAHLLARIAETAPGSSARGAGSVAGSPTGSAVWRRLFVIATICGVGILLFFLFPDRSSHQPAPVPAPKPAALQETSPAVVQPQVVDTDSTTPTVRNTESAAKEKGVLAAPRPTATAPSRTEAKSVTKQPRDDGRALREYMEKKEKSAAGAVEENDEVHTTIGSKK